MRNVRIRRGLGVVLSDELARILRERLALANVRRGDCGKRLRGEWREQTDRTERIDIAGHLDAGAAARDPAKQLPILAREVVAVGKVRAARAELVDDLVAAEGPQPVERQRIAARN
eukprot:2711536-Prymnesium_polylepis.2